MPESLQLTPIDNNPEEETRESCPSPRDRAAEKAADRAWENGKWPKDAYTNNTYPTREWVEWYVDERGLLYWEMPSKGDPANREASDKY